MTEWIEEFMGSWLPFSRSLVSGGTVNRDGEKIESLLAKSGMSARDAKEDFDRWYDHQPQTIPQYRHVSTYIGHLKGKVHGNEEHFSGSLNPGYYTASGRVFAVYRSGDEWGVFGVHFSNGQPFTGYFLRKTLGRRGEVGMGDLETATDPQIRQWKAARDAWRAQRVGEGKTLNHSRYGLGLKGPDEEGAVVAAVGGPEDDGIPF